MAKAPMNAAAEEIIRLRGINNDIDTQIMELWKAKDRNSEIIGVYGLTALWGNEEVPPPTQPEPEIPVVEPDPEVTPEEGVE